MQGNLHKGKAGRSKPSRNSAYLRPFFNLLRPVKAKDFYLSCSLEGEMQTGLPSISIVVFADSSDCRYPCWWHSSSPGLVVKPPSTRPCKRACRRQSGTAGFSCTNSTWGKHFLNPWFPWIRLSNRAASSLKNFSLCWCRRWKCVNSQITKEALAHYIHLRRIEPSGNNWKITLYDCTWRIFWSRRGAWA